MLAPSLVDALTVCLLALVAAYLIVCMAGHGTALRALLGMECSGLITALVLTSFMTHGAGALHYGAAMECAVGFALFVAVLSAWPAAFMYWTSLSVVAMIAGVGLYEMCCGAAPVAGLLNVNHFGCFVAVALPTILGMFLDSVRRRTIWPVALALLFAVLLLLLVASKCRTAVAAGTVALVGMAGVYATRHGVLPRIVAYAQQRQAWTRVVMPTCLTIICAAFVAVTRVGGVAEVGLASASADKSLSAAGRTLIWRLAGRIACAHWPHGLGFGNFGRVCNLYQAEYFAHGTASVPVRMAAGQIGHAFSEPLELWAELGLWGVIILIALGVLISCEFGKLILRYLRMKHEETRTIVRVDYGIDIVAVGMGFAVLSFLLLSLVHFPRKIMPTFAVFNIALAWVVRVNGGNLLGSCETEQQWGRWKRWLWAAFWAIVCLCACVLTPYHVRRYLAARHWRHAVALAQKGDLTGALDVCGQIQARLAWNGKFRAFQGDLLLSSATDTNWPAPTNVQRATELYEHAKYTHPYPFMFENLAVAYLRLADGTNWPVVVQTQYRMETPTQTLVRKVREWRCGTNLFFEPPPTRFTQSDCIGRAIEYLTLASNILPWRLTSRWYLAQVYHDVGDVSNAVKYAQLVVNIPMKKDTSQGREFKRKAQNMLIELGVKCDDPGLVVFDIHERRTWNEGRW